MAKTNRSTNTSTKQAAMLADLNNAADIISQGPTGFLFAAQMPDGSIQWMAGGELAGYDNKTSSAAMRLYIEAQKCSLKSA